MTSVTRKNYVNVVLSSCKIEKKMFGDPDRRNAYEKNNRTFNIMYFCNELMRL